jgi:hypothetical protein
MADMEDKYLTIRDENLELKKLNAQREKDLRLYVCCITSASLLYPPVLLNIGVFPPYVSITALTTDSK